MIRQTLQTSRQGFYDITTLVQSAVCQCQVENGICIVHCPHTTAGLTINENADPDVQHDLLLQLEKIAPNRKEFLHCEGNSAAHLKASLMGHSLTIMVENGKLLLGRWQGIYFCEFDGPRTRNFWVKPLHFSEK